MRTVCREHGVRAATYRVGSGKSVDGTVSDLTRMRELEAENARLKCMYAEPALDNSALKDILSRRL